MKINMTLKLEKLLVEDFIIQKLTKNNWTYVESNKLERSVEEPLIKKNLREAIRRINKHIDLTEDDIEKVLKELKIKGLSPKDCREILIYYKEGIPIRLEKTNELKYIKLFDYENIENNEFIVSRQVVFEEYERMIADIILFVNGIPLVIIECKNPADPSVSWENAYRDIMNYAKRFKELFKYLQIGIAAEKNVRYFPIVPWLENVRVEKWRSIKGDKNKSELEAIIEMLEPKVLLDIIKNFIFIRSEAGKNYTKVIARYIQYRAANKIYERVVKAIVEKHPKEKRKGLIWHWQGSGKTLTMIFVAHKLFKEKILNKPTIFFVVDRRELEEQIFQEISAIEDLGIAIERVESKEKLKELLLYDNGRGRRGIIIVLLHKFKFENKDAIEIKNSLEQMGTDTIVNRENVIVFVDEAHRSQYGILAAYMKYLLKNAFYFAFTGTPRNEADKNTFELFSPKDELYLDKYFFSDSIEDGFTLKIVYELAPEELRLDRKKLYNFLDEELEELSFEEKVKLSSKINEIKIFLENDNRIEKIAEFIAFHFRNRIDGKFKAFVVAASRVACIKYKRALNKFLPKEYSEIVMTYNKDDPKDIIEYLEELKKKYGISDPNEINKKIVEKFKSNFDGNPKILIVTDMLLTGFDAPILQTMYLDKPLKGNKLLQTIARVNRPLEERGKAFGLIVDFVGIFSEIERALEKLEIDRKTKKFEFNNIEDIKEELKSEIEEMKKLLKGIDISDLTSEERLKINLEKALSRIVEENKDKIFIEKFNKIRNLYISLGPEKEKIEYENIVRFLQMLFEIYRKSINEKIGSETTELYFIDNILKGIYETIDIKSITNEYIKKIDRKFIEALRAEDERKKLDEDSKIFNRITIIKNVIREKPNIPKYISIREKIENVIKRYRERKEKIKELLVKELDEILVKEILEFEEKIKESGLSEYEMNVVEMFENNLKINNEEILRNIEKKSKEFFEKIRKEKEQGNLTIYNLKNFEYVIKMEIREKFIYEIQKELRKIMQRSLSEKEKDKIVEGIFEIVKEFIKRKDEKQKQN